MEDQKTGPRLACNVKFANGKGLKPKVKKVSKIVYIGRRGEQTSLTLKRITKGVWEPAAEQFFWKK